MWLYPISQGDVWICMELLDSSMDKISKRVYNELSLKIPEGILGKMTVAVIKALHYLKTKLEIIHRGQRSLTTHVIMFTVKILIKPSQKGHNNVIIDLLL